MARIVYRSVLAIFLFLLQDSSSTYLRGICNDMGFCSLLEECHDGWLCQLPFNRLESIFFSSAPLPFSMCFGQIPMAMIAKLGMNLEYCTKPRKLRSSDWSFSLGACTMASTLTSDTCNPLSVNTFPRYSMLRTPIWFLSRKRYILLDFEVIRQTCHRFVELFSVTFYFVWIRLEDFTDSWAGEMQE